MMKWMSSTVQISIKGNQLYTTNKTLNSILQQKIKSRNDSNLGVNKNGAAIPYHPPPQKT